MPHLRPIGFAAKPDVGFEHSAWIGSAGGMVRTPHVLGGRKQKLALFHRTGQNAATLLQVGPPADYFPIHFTVTLKSAPFFFFLFRGRLLARTMACVIQPSPEALDQLGRLTANRHYADCKPAVELAFDELKSSSSEDGRSENQGEQLLRKLVPLLYSRPYLSRLLWSSSS